MSEKYYIHVKYDEKEHAKENGAKWCKIKKQWYVTDKDDPLLEKYGIVYLNVPFKDKEIAKELYAAYDMEVKKWYGAKQNVELINTFI
jgi:hypothetical protein